MIVNNFNVRYKSRLCRHVPQVSDIKKQLHFGVKAIAKKFNVSDMQIHRIKTKENWAHVKL